MPLAVRPAVYVAGPMSNGGTLPHDQIMDNVRKGLAVGEELYRLGYAPLVPHLSEFWKSATGFRPTYDGWLDMDFSWVGQAHAVFVMPGESKGAACEFAYASKCGVFATNSLDHLKGEVPPRPADWQSHTR